MYRRGIIHSAPDALSRTFMQGEEPLIQSHILALEDGDEKELDPSQVDDDIDIPQGLEEDIV